MTRPAMYLRVSSREQAEGFSLSAQERAIRAFCVAQGWDEPTVFADAGKSGFTDVTAKRPAFAAMLEAAERGEYDVVVVHKLDRFARSLITTLRELQRLERHDVTFASVSESLDFSTPIGRVLLALLASFAEFYSRNLSTEVKKGLREKEARGLHLGPVPWGAIRVDGLLRIDPERADELARVLDLARTESGYTIVKELNARGVPAPKGRRWWPQTVRRLVAEGRWLAAMPDPWPERWRAAVRRAPLPRAGNSTKARLRPLSGLMRCACGEAMQYVGVVRTRRDGTTYSAVRCRGRRERGGGECPGGGHTNAEEYERQVRDWANGLPLEEYHRALARRGGDPDATLAALAERRRLLLLALADGLPEHEYRARKVALDREIALVAPSDDEGIALLEDVIAGLGKWDELSPAGKNGVWRVLIARVVITGHVAEVVPSERMREILGA